MEDAGLVLLRALTVAARVALAVALVLLVRRGGEGLASVSRRAWVTLCVAYVILAFDNTILEILAVLHWRGGLAGVDTVRMAVYHITYLLHAVLAAALPALLLAIYHPAASALVRILAVLPAVAVAAVSVALGALTEWDVLLASSRVLSFLSILSFLAFWTFVLLGWTRRVDAYLAGFVAVETLFEVLLPIQEIFFQLLGPEQASEMWHLSQFLQFATASAQLAVVLALTTALTSGRPVRVVRLLA